MWMLQASWMPSHLPPAFTHRTTICPTADRLPLGIYSAAFAD